MISQSDNRSFVDVVDTSLTDGPFNYLITNLIQGTRSRLCSQNTHTIIYSYLTSTLIHLYLHLHSPQALCCIDKKGILSWPNPTAEKVFFLRNSSPASPSSSNTSLGGSMGRGDSTPEPSERPHEPTTVAEVSVIQDVTYTQQ